MALMQKMTLGSAAGGPGGKLKRFVKKKVQGFKMKQAQRKLEDRKAKLESGEEGINFGNKKVIGNAISSSTPRMNNSEETPSRASNAAKENSSRESKRGKLIANKYGNQAVYKTVKGLKNLGDRFEQMGMKAKSRKGFKRAMQDAAGPTSRNKDVMVCKEGQCQAR